MGTVKEYIDNLKRIKSLIPDEVGKCIKDNEQEIINLQQDQLYSGERSDGSQITPFYSANTQIIKRSKGQPFNRVTLYDEGDFYRGIRTKFFTNNQRLDVFSTDSKTKELTDKYGERIIGLNEENKRFIEGLVVEWLDKFIKREI